MKVSLYISILGLLFLTVDVARAQSADDFFHSGARSYVESQLPVALEAVNAGLDVDPDNARLTALKQEIEKEMENQEQQQGDNSQQSSDDQQQQQQEQSDEENSEQESEQQEDPEQQEQEQQDEQQQNQSEENESEENEEQGEQTPQDTPPDPNELSKEQAERILQALENEEEKLLREVQKIKGRPRRVEKDW